MATTQASLNSDELHADPEKSGSAYANESSIVDSEKQSGDINNDNSDFEKVHIDVAAESRLLRKLDTRLIPLLFVLCEYSHQLSTSLFQN